MAQRYARFFSILVPLLFLLPLSAFGQNESVFGNLCVGLDCDSGETFGETVLKMKDINVRLEFDDFSSSPSFPANDWQITINSAVSGEGNFFAVDDLTGATRPFLVEATAQDNALVISDTDGASGTGYVGVGTDSPQMELHLFHGDTPGVRIEQDGTQGFGSYAWDVAANEFGYFVRDVTAGNAAGSEILPFRIVSGTDTNLLTLREDQVGIGTIAPQASFDIQQDQPTVRVRNTSTLVNTFNLDENGNLTLSGVLTEASSMHRKENRAVVDPAAVLETLKEVPVETWNYRTDADGIRHMGPMAQTFYAAFGLGVDEEHLAPLDANGVALAAIQGLLERVESLEETSANTQNEIATLRKENADLKRRMERLEQLVRSQMDQKLPANAPSSGERPASGTHE